MELEDLKQLIELLKETDITEIQVEKEGTKVKIKREKFFQSLDIATQLATSVNEPVIKKEIEDDTQRLITVTSPIVGTFYRSPSPEAPIFVETGLRVKTGQVLCIIEAMKLMNEIQAETSGEVVKIYVENGQAVEYGQPLFGIKQG